MRLKLLASAAFVTCAMFGAAVSSAATHAAPVSAVPAVGAVVSVDGKLEIRHEVVKLANGFEVILVEDHRLPLVALNLWVHAGPRNEAVGQTGFAHLFEHLMFAGSKHIPRGEADRIIDAAGGTDSNGSTNFDRTNFFYTLPSNQLELGLWIKSDMLGYMIDQVDSVALANQQDVVRNERRQSYENRPYGIVEEAIYHELFPEGHPYRAMIIGSHADIQSIKLPDVQAFARRYYRPNNATLVIAGDFKPAEAKRLVQKYFGPLQAGEPVPPVVMAQPQITAEKRITVTDHVELPRLSMAWHSPAIFKPGDADLDVASFILGGGKSSRLYKTLVYERQLAQSVGADQQSLSLGSIFGIDVVARPGHKLEEIEPLVDAALAELAATPPSAEEMQRARAVIKTQSLAQLEKIGNVADLVNQYNQQAGDPDYLATDLARYDQVTPESVSAAVARYLRKDARVVAYALPGDQVLAPEVPTPPAPTLAAKGEAQSLNADAAWRGTQPKAGPAPALHLPAGPRFTLANGLTVIHIDNPGLPLVSASLVLRAGQTANPPEMPGLASFTASMLQEGTTTRSAQQLADQIDDIGVALGASAGHDAAQLDLFALKSQFAQGMDLLADMALHPAFAPQEVERRRAARLAALAQQHEDPNAVAAVAAQRAVYGTSHPLGGSSLGDEAAIQAIDSTALRQFWQTHYRPDQAALVVAGDVSEAEVRTLAEVLFGAWQRPAEPAPTTAEAALHSSSARVVLIDKPGAPQTALAVVEAGPAAGQPDSASIRVMNAALGGLFTSRINTELREVKGYTYGIYSDYNMGAKSGMFGIQGSVRTDVTGPALSDMFKQIDGMRAKPMGAAELNRVRNAELLALPGLLDTNAAVAGSYASQWSLGLPADSITQLPAKYAAVTADSAFHAAQVDLNPSGLIVIAVGDKAKILPQLEALGRRPLVELDLNGQPAKPVENPSTNPSPAPSAKMTE